MIVTVAHAVLSVLRYRGKHAVLSVKAYGIKINMSLIEPCLPMGLIYGEHTSDQRGSGG